MGRGHGYLAFLDRGEQVESTGLRELGPHAVLMLGAVRPDGTVFAHYFPSPPRPAATHENQRCHASKASAGPCSAAHRWASPVRGPAPIASGKVLQSVICALLTAPASTSRCAWQISAI